MYKDLASPSAGASSSYTAEPQVFIVGRANPQDRCVHSNARPRRCAEVVPRYVSPIISADHSVDGSLLLASKFLLDPLSCTSRYSAPTQTVCTLPGIRRISTVSTDFLTQSWPSSSDNVPVFCELIVRKVLATIMGGGKTAQLHIHHVIHVIIPIPNLVRRLLTVPLNVLHWP